MFNQTKQVGIWEVLDFRYTSFDHMRQPMAVWDFNSGFFSQPLSKLRQHRHHGFQADSLRNMEDCYENFLHDLWIEKYIESFIIFWDMAISWCLCNIDVIHDDMFNLTCKKTQSNIKNMCATIISLYFFWYVLDILLYSVSSIMYSYFFDISEYFLICAIIYSQYVFGY